MRRALAACCAAAAGALAPRRDVLAALAALAAPKEATVPLEKCGDAYCVAYALDGVSFRAVVDTGSPFLQASCASANWRLSPAAECFDALRKAPVADDDTLEVFGGGDGVVRWRSGNFALPGTHVSSALIFGVPDSKLLRAPGGGLFFGLIKDRADGIRPPLLEQLDVGAYDLDLRAEPKLTLYRKSPRWKQGHRLSTIDLRSYGAPARYVATRVNSLRVDGAVFFTELPIFAIFDSGVTGAQMSNDLYEKVGRCTRLSASFSEARLSARRKGNLRFVVTGMKVPWGQGRCHVLALGLAFLQDHRLLVDLDKPQSFVLVGDVRPQTWDA
ncbi:hypothetical protein M885DRAFT_539210 [Pelagophyceae sp. CCMP2097]|nr:hypothetical protein M885DRAFT_539210 [Pelagophyceae sp. CCMP2097]|mmetsp:Transcript_957/g.3069  ORF Transcript_957/g.3069 Transcript_957/m.3069 type:complete len:329 (-) Transcript_957:39-1025(-)